MPVKMTTRRTLYTDIRGYEYCVRRRDIELAVQEWLMTRSALYVKMGPGGTWSFDWDEDDNGNVELIVQHMVTETKPGVVEQPTDEKKE